MQEAARLASQYFYHRKVKTVSTLLWAERTFEQIILKSHKTTKFLILTLCSRGQGVRCLSAQEDS